MIASKEYVLKKIKEDNLFPKKKFSQNFLINQDIAEKIISLLEIDSRDVVLEIGAGLGALSEIILQKGIKLWCYEIDYRMCEHLKRTFSCYDNFTLIPGDFLKQKIVSEETVKVITNLPYAETTAIIEKIIKDINIVKFVFMVQKEVSTRLEAKISSKEYAPLSIMLEHVGILKKEFLASRKNFFPSPNVDSLVYSLTINKKRNLIIEQKFYTFLKVAFSQRRKTLWNNLICVYDKVKVKTVYEKFNLDKTIRPEAITYSVYLQLFHEFTN